MEKLQLEGKNPHMDRTLRQPVERVQLGVRMEKRMVKVLKGVAEFNGVSLGQLLENIVLHTFDPVPGEEGEHCYSPHSKKALEVIEQLKRIYDFDYEVHPYRWVEEPPAGENEADKPQ